MVAVIARDDRRPLPSLPSALAARGWAAALLFFIFIVILRVTYIYQQIR